MLCEKHAKVFEANECRKARVYKFSRNLRATLTFCWPGGWPEARSELRTETYQGSLYKILLRRRTDARNLWTPVVQYVTTRCETDNGKERLQIAWSKKSRSILQSVSTQSRDHEVLYSIDMGILPRGGGGKKQSKYEADNTPPPKARMEVHLHFVTRLHSVCSFTLYSITSSTATSPKSPI